MDIQDSLLLGVAATIVGCDPGAQLEGLLPVHVLGLLMA